MLNLFESVSEGMPKVGERILNRLSHQKATRASSDAQLVHLF
jgi:hypothetical protein